MSNKLKYQDHTDPKLPIVPAPVPDMELVTLHVNVPKGFGRPQAHAVVMLGQNNELVVGLSKTPIIGHTVLAEYLLKVVLDAVRKESDGGDDKKTEIIIPDRNIKIIRA